jgi:5-formyltetrahydrofolate cyclo-ligase
MPDLSAIGWEAARRVSRQRLLAARCAFVQSRDGPAAMVTLADHLMSVLLQLAPERLGIYWPVQCEFDAAAACTAAHALADTPLALPFAFREPPRIEFRHWDRLPPVQRDECGIGAAAGPVVVPDVVLAPCVGYTATGLRLGYGGGYFDRWMAAHPHATVVGVAWSVGLIDEAELQPQPHDHALACVVTERGVI